jgi:hypothetical protein
MQPTASQIDTLVSARNREEAKQPPDGIMREISLPAATPTQRVNQDDAEASAPKSNQTCQTVGDDAVADVKR